MADFDEANITLPTRRYVTFGDVAFDCAQLTVSVGAMATGTLAGDHGGPPHPGEVPIAALMIALVRDCAPTVKEGGEAPTAEELEAFAAPALADADVLMRVFLKKANKSIGGCKNVKVMSLVPYGPEGGVAGWLLTLRVHP